MTSLQELPTKTSPNAAARLYAHVRNNDPERSSGAQVAYASFDDFITTFEVEASDPQAFGAADVLDMLNPLQHIPLVSRLYQKLSGDQVKPGAANIMGGTLFGGGLGLASASVNNAVIYETGKDMQGHVIATLEMPGNSQESTPPTQFEIVWNEPTPPIKHDSFYRNLPSRAYQSAGQAYTQVAMRDPERSAGSFTAYA